MSPPSAETTMARAVTKSDGTMAGLSSSEPTATASGQRSNNSKTKDQKNVQKELKRRLQQTMKSPGNKKCCDCHDRRPTWASFIKPHDNAPTDSRTLVCFVCYQCASLHRKLGTHICSVRSVSLDDWNEWDVESSELSGNTIVNYIYEANWEQMNKDNPAAEISRPAHGAHGATVERFIRQKYETKMFYNKTKHYDHNFDARQKLEAMVKAKAKKDMMTSPTPKSPSARKRLGAFLEATVRSPIAIVGKLSGSRSVGLVGDGTGTTEESSISDNKSFFSVPALSSDAAKKKRGTRNDRHGRHHHHKSGSSNNDHRDRHSHRDKLKMHQSFSGSSGMGMDSSGSRRSIVDLHSSTSWLDSQMPLKGGESENEGDGSRHNTTTRIQKCSNHSQNSNESSGGGSESGGGGGGLLKKAEKKHIDPRRRSFHDSKSGGFDFSSSDLDFSSDDLDLGDSQGNLRSKGPNTPRKPKLVSSTLVGNEPSPHNSRMNLYTHKQKQNGRGRSRSHSRVRDSAVEDAVNRSRSKSRLRGENGTDSRQRRNVGRSRSRGPTTDERRERYGGRSRSSSRIRDGNNEPFSERASRRVSERRGRSRSIVRDQDIIAGATPKVKRDGRSSSRIMSSSKVLDSRETRKGGLDRQRSVRRTKSEDLTDLAAGIATSNKELGRVDPKPPLERAKSDDLSGMVLVLDESTNEILNDHRKSSGKHKRRSFQSPSENKETVRRSSRKLKGDEDDGDERTKSGRSHGHSEGQEDWGNSSISVSYDENDDDGKVERPTSRRSRGHSERQREWGNSSTSLSYDGKDGKSEQRPRSRRSNGSSERRRSRDWGNSSKSLNYDEKEDEERPLSRRSNGHRERRKDNETEAGVTSPSHRSSRRGGGRSRSLTGTTKSIERSRSRSRNRNDNDEEEEKQALKDTKPRRGRRDTGSERNSTRSIRTYLDQQVEHGLSCPASSRSMASKIVSEQTVKEESDIRTPKEIGRRSSHKSKAFKSISLHETSDTGESPHNSGEKDFQVIKAKPFALGGGSDHSFGSIDSFHDSSNFHTSFSRDVGKDRFIKEARRCSREKRLEKTNQRMSRKSDIFASLDREENEASGPLGEGLRRGVSRSKSGVGAPKLMLRAPPKRSKSSDGVLLASNPRLDLGVELGKGSNNDALMKAWKARKEANEKYLAQFESTARK